MDIFISRKAFIREIFESDEQNEILIEIKAKIEVCFQKAKKLLHDNIVNEQLLIDDQMIEKLMKYSSELITFMINDKPKTGQRESLEFLIECFKERIIKLICHSLGFNAPFQDKPQRRKTEVINDNPFGEFSAENKKQKMTKEQILDCIDTALQS